VAIGEDEKNARMLAAVIAAVSQFALWFKGEGDEGWVRIGDYANLDRIEHVVKSRRGMKKNRGRENEYAVTEIDANLNDPKWEAEISKLIGFDWPWGLYVLLGGATFYYGKHHEMKDRERACWPV
jgi:hypothetical protein